MDRRRRHLCRVLVSCGDCASSRIAQQYLVMADIPERAATQEAGQSGLWMIVFGSILGILAPLAGFLGGSKVGAAGAAEDVDPLLQWLIAGLGVGGIGVLLASVGVLRWVSANRHLPLR